MPDKEPKLDWTIFFMGLLPEEELEELSQLPNGYC
jgi:hypothetical protein